MKRLALYSFYQKAGIVSSFIFYYLEQLSKFADIVFSVNGILSPESRKVLEAKGYTVCCRDNIGFDFGAWKDILLSRDSLYYGQYDEIILCNCSCYGPVSPFSGIFSEMNGRACDFWGLYQHPGIKGIFPPHIQSYFLVIRKRLFQSDCFRDYFNRLSYARNWDEAVRQEVNFSSYFWSRGFVSSSYIGSALSRYIEDPTIFMPAELLKLGFPFIKRKCFTSDYREINKTSSSVQIKELFNCLKNTGYPTGLIYEDLLRSRENSHLIKALGLCYVLDRSNETHPEEKTAGKTAAVIYSSDAGRVQYNIRYLNSLPGGSFVCIVTSSEEISKEWQSKLGMLGRYRTEIRTEEDAGSKETAYWLTCRDVIESYDYICLIHDLDDNGYYPPIKERFLSDHCFSGLLFSEEYVLNILRLFQQNERLGLLMPFLPMFAEWPDKRLNEEWAGNRETAAGIYSRLHLSVPFDEHPVSPWGGMFWLRSRAVREFCRYGWTKHDFDPAEIHGNAAEALDSMYPMIAQESGFFSGCICPSELAGCQFANMYFNLQKYSRGKISGDVVHFSNVKEILGLYLKRKLRKVLGKIKKT